MGNRQILQMLLLVAAISSAWGSSGHNTTHILAKFPSFSTMSKLLVETGVVREIDTRSSLTVLLVPNSVLDAFVSSVGDANLLLIADVLRYHCILQYLDIPEIRSMANATGTTLPTLYQTTGRATGTMGFIKVAVNPKTKAIRLGLPESDVFNATVVTNVTQFPYNVSYMQVDHVVTPAGLQNSAAASPSVSSGIAQLKKLGNFNIVLGLLDSTGVAKSLKAMSAVTILVPQDSAFKDVPIDRLSQAEKIKLVQFHCVPTYFTFGSLQSITTPLPTVATSSGSGKFSLNVTAAGKDGVSFMTGINNGSVVETIVDDPPVAIYSVDKVLLPPEIFASVLAPAGAPGPSPFPSPEMSPSPTPELSPSPSPEMTSPSPSPSPELAPSPSPLAASPPAPPLSPSSLSPDVAPSGSNNNSGAMVLQISRSSIVFFVTAAAALAL